MVLPWKITTGYGPEMIPTFQASSQLGSREAVTIIDTSGEKMQDVK